MSKELVGSWRLLEFEVVNPSGVKLGPFPKPGIALYSQEGFLSVFAGTDEKTGHQYPDVVAKDIAYTARYSFDGKILVEEYLFHTFKERIGEKREINIDVTDDRLVKELSHKDHLLRFTFDRYK